MHGNWKHGDCDSAEYGIWKAMKSRCRPGCNTAKNHGDKGIRVCERWQSYDNFLADMGRRPSDQHTIERKDSTKDYSKENCVWATRVEQNNNTSRNVRIKLYGITLTAAQWARIAQVNENAIIKRLRRGWSHKQAVWVPIQSRTIQRKV